MFNRAICAARKIHETCLVKRIDVPGRPDQKYSPDISFDELHNYLGKKLRYLCTEKELHEIINSCFYRNTESWTDEERYIQRRNIMDINHLNMSDRLKKSIDHKNLVFVELLRYFKEIHYKHVSVDYIWDEFICWSHSKEEFLKIIESSNLFIINKKYDTLSIDKTYIDLCEKILGIKGLSTFNICEMLAEELEDICIQRKSPRLEKKIIIV